MSRLVPTLFALVVWLALWGEISVINVASGVLVVAILAMLFGPGPRGHTLNPIALVKLLAVFVWRLVSSSVTVVAAVLSPTPARLRSGVVGVRLSQPSPLVATIVADAISLTPGTVTLETRYDEGDDRESPSVPPVLYIHVLGLDDPDAIRTDVQRLERLVVSAVTPHATPHATEQATAQETAEEDAS
ncbi:MAG: Na+/H+ antiporter subunit E [Ilumatobacter sp.]|uniref:Na+/H+ antiporter subunit E n=1 Tax=Ilumatobacter sp. TaxID=1967498 RepID=UPI00391A9D9F